MNKNKINMIMPKTIYLLRAEKNPFAPNGECSPQGRAEYNIYYDNIIYPFGSAVNIEICCKYGMDHGRFWRFDGICEEDAFSLVIQVRSPFGALILEHECVIRMVNNPNKEINLLCVGDSMTRAGVYIARVTQVMAYVNAIGTRGFDGKGFCEGRGGWTLKQYFERVNAPEGVSPFLFPENIKGDEYFGDLEFWRTVLSEKGDGYDYIGFQKTAEWILQKKIINTHIEGEYEFNFSKYISKYKSLNNIGKVDIVSILFGANDFKNICYDDSEAKIQENLKLLEELIKSVKGFDPDISVMINLPVLSGKYGAEDYTGEKRRYDYHMLSYSKEILEKWDTDEAYESGIFVVPMHAMTDCRFGFSVDSISQGKYSNIKQPIVSEWVHPSKSGYSQMGDALLGALAATVK